MKFRGGSVRERDFVQNFQNALHGSGILFKIFNMLCTGARFFSKFAGRSAWERDVPKIQDALHGARFFSQFSGCSARERN